MKLSTSDQIPGSSISTTLGIARGSTVRTRNVGYDIFAGLKTLLEVKLNLTQSFKQTPENKHYKE